MNIANREEIFTVAEECQLDMGRFSTDFAAGEGHNLAREEYEEAINRFMVTAVPTVFFGQARVVGAAYHCRIISRSWKSLAYARLLAVDDRADSP